MIRNSAIESRFGMTQASAGAAVGSAASRNRRYSRLRRQKICVATPVQRHLLAADGFADLRIGHLNRDHAIADLYFLSSLPNLHGRVDLQRAVYVNRHT